MNKKAFTLAEIMIVLTVIGILTAIFSPSAIQSTPYENGFDIAYKIFCIDVDGINKGEDSFGYGIRADGKIMTGKRANEWLQKSIQNKE